MSIKNGAVIKGPYRYILWRVWDFTLPQVFWIMLNPSTADEYQDDPTIRRLMGFSRAWGYGGILVGNFYAYRATDPKELFLDPAFDYVGPENMDYLKEMETRAGITIIAPGEKVQRPHFEEVCAKLDPNKLHYLRLNRSGIPAHPLYLPGNLRPEKFEVAA